MKQPDVHSAQRFIRPVTCGVLAGAAVCLLLLAAMSAVMGFRDVPQQAVMLVSTLIFVIAGFTAGYVSAAFSRERGMMTGLLCGICMFLILGLASLVMNGAEFGAAALAKLVAVLLAAALGGIVGVNKKRKFKN